MENALRCIERNINPNISRFKDSDLRICLSLQQFQVDFGVLSQKERIPLALVRYAFPPDKTYSENIECLLAEEKLLDPAFHYASRSFCVQEFKSTLIPEKLYEEQYGSAYLNALFHLNGRECMTQESEPNSASRILSAFNANYLKAAKSLFVQEDEDIGFVSVYSRLIHEGYRMARSFKRFPNHIILHTRRREFDLAVVNDGGLLFINTFPYPDFDNLLYYFLYALNRLKLDLGDSALYLCGTASQKNLLPKFEQQVYAVTYLPSPKDVRFPHEMPYDRYFCCL